MRSVTAREPDWTDQDRAEALALALYESQLCPCGCGHMARDTFSHEDTGPEFTVRRIRCRARDAQLISQNDATLDRPGAVLWWTEKGLNR